MDCITFNKEIDAFLNDRLDDEELNEFLNHLKSCSGCCEELEINYIVHEAMIRLGKNDSGFNLASAYRHELKNSQEYMEMRKRLMLVSFVFRTLTFWVLLGTLFVFFRVLFFGQ